MDVVELTRELIRIPSTTNEEGEVCRFVIERLQRQGWSVSTQEIAPETPPQPNALPRLNVLAKTDPNCDPKVVLTTHLDTVPPYIPLTEDEENLYGRGTCDAKGIFAAQWVAAHQLRAAGHEVALLGVVGEETDSRGAKAVSTLLPRAGYIIDGEPTQLTMASGAKGILSLGLKWTGQAGHSAYPETGRSATHDMIAALARLVAAELPYEDTFGPTTVNVGQLSGGVASNVLAPYAEASVMIRLGGSREAVFSEVQRILGPDVEVEIRSSSEPHTMLVPEGMESEIVRFGSDVPYLNQIAPCLLVGPGSIHDAHTRHEYIRKQDLYTSVELYKQVAEALLNQA